MSAEYNFSFDLAMRRLTAEERQKNFRQSKAIADPITGALKSIKVNGEYQLCTLDTVFNIKQRHRLPEINNQMDAFYKKTKIDNLSSIFTTLTLKSKYNLTDLQDLELSLKQLGVQFDIFSDFWDGILDARMFKDPAKNKRNYGQLKDWIFADKRPFIKSSEFTEKQNAHQHINIFLPNDHRIILEFARLIEQKKNLFDIGRTDCIFEPQFKKVLTGAFDLVPCDRRKGKQIYRPNRNEQDKKDFLNGHAMIFSFYDNSKDAKTEIMSYVMKYVLKGVNTHGSDISPDIKLNDPAYRTKAVFMELSRRSFSYSRNYIFPITIFRKVAPALSWSCNKYKKISFWTAMQDKQFLKIKRFPEDTKEKLAGFEVWLTETIDGVPFTRLIAEWWAGGCEVVNVDDIHWKHFDWDKCLEESA
jgi:hypothetical protein